MKNKKLLITSLAIGISQFLIGQSSLVKDINLGTSGSYPTNFSEWNGEVYFAAEASGQGTELWKTDGSAAGTVLVKDINTQNSGGSFPRDFTPIGNNLLFVATDGINGSELWSTDGSPTGTTTMLKDIDTTAGYGSNIDFITEMGGNIYFSASDGYTVHGDELWVSDGTVSGTQMLLDIYPGSSSAYISDIIAVNNTLFFGADNGTDGLELWKSDGTVNGTVSVKDIWPGSFGAYPSQMIALGNEVFFVASDGSLGRELWKSDGTISGTTMVMDINVGQNGSNISNEMIVFNNELYFVADDGSNGSELWKTDGLTTVNVKYINATAQTGSNAMDFAISNNELFFSADDGVNGTELWKTDGTGAGTISVKDINTTSATASSYPFSLVSFNNELYFSANNGSDGSELWKSDGTGVGTVQVEDIYPGSNGSFPLELIVLGNQLLFSAQFDDFGTYNSSELWRYTLPVVLVSNIVVQGQNNVSTIISNGGTLQMEAIVTPSNATDGSYVWTVTNGTGSATIAANGMLTAQTNGTVTVTATANDASGKISNAVITISNQIVLVNSIAVQGQSGATTITTNGGTLQMEATVLPSNATDATYTWTIANGTGSGTIATNGILTAQTDGTVTVTATANDASGTIGSTVITISNQIVLVNSIAVQGQSGATTITTNGGTLQMEATVLPSTATDATYTWTIANGTGSGTIATNGILTAQTDGTVTVTATANDGSGTIGSAVVTFSNQSVGVEAHALSTVRVFPNPTSDVVTFETEVKIKSIVILNTAGQIVAEYDNVQIIDISNLVNGVYLAKIVTDNSAITMHRLIKE